MEWDNISWYIYEGSSSSLSIKVKPGKQFQLIIILQSPWSHSQVSIGRYYIANICIIIPTHTIPSKNESNFMGSTNIFDIVGIPWMNFIFSIGFPQQHTILTTIDHSFWMSNSSPSNFQDLDEPLILTAWQARVELKHGHITILTTTRTLIICLWKLYTNTMWSQRPPPFNAKLRSREIWINPSPK